MIAGVGKVMKRRVVKISLAIFAVIGIALGMLVVLMRDWGSEMPLAFLDGMPMMDRIEQHPARSGSVTTYDLYSSEADFNEVCTKADAELPSLGFKVNLPGPFSHPPGPFLRHYQLFDATSEVWIVVTIRAGRAVRVSTRVTPQGSSRYPRHYRKNGCVLETSVLRDGENPCIIFLGPIA